MQGGAPREDTSGGKLEAVWLSPEPRDAPEWPAASMSEPEPEQATETDATAAAAAKLQQEVSEALWDRTDTVCKRVGDGLGATAELIKFFKKRVAAEKALALGMKSMSVSESGKLLGGVPGRQNTVELMDSLTENAPSVKQAWAMMVWNTQQTCIAHEDLAIRMGSELIGPLEEWLKEKEKVYKKLAAEGNKIANQLASNLEKVQKEQQKHYTAGRAATAAEQAAVAGASPRASVRVPSTDDAKMIEKYEAQVSKANESEKELAARSQPVLRTLCEIEMERIDITKNAMTTFVNMSAIELPMAIGKPVAEEMTTSIDAIDGVADVRTFKKRQASGNTCASIEVRPYDAVRDVLPEHRSLAQLAQSGGGPIHSGWLHKEGHRRKNFKKRCGVSCVCVALPCFGSRWGGLPVGIRWPWAPCLLGSRLMPASCGVRRRF
eukprot:SAG22_NODE_1348_length_4662_cov_2.722113_6_plen_436_part_00